MSKRKSRYREMERCMTIALILDLIVFTVFLLSAGLGIIWLKVFTAIIAILLSGLCLAFLYLSRELLRPRSLWMSVASAAIVLCTLFSLVLNFPSPNPYSQTKSEAITADSDSSPN